MNHIVIDCPHCRSLRMTFEVEGESRLHKIVQDYAFCWNIFATCRNCSNGVVVILASVDDNAFPPSSFTGNPIEEGFILLQTFPDQRVTKVPEHLNKAIAKDFLEAVDNLKSGRYTSAGMMFRRVLQRSTTALIDNPSALKSKTLKQRVYILADKGIITEAMRDWADIIRLEGNSANHDEEEYGQGEFTPEDATQLHRFTELFLTYAFTLPARVMEYHVQSKPESSSHTSDFMPPRKPGWPQLNTG